MSVPILIPKYKRLDNDSRYTLCLGGRGSGKSFHVCVYLLLLTYKPGEVILFTRYTMTSAKISIIPEFVEKMDLYGIRQHFDISGNIITNRHSGSRIIFSGIKTSSGNQTANLKSIAGLTMWVLDEAEEMVNKAEFDKIDDSIRQKGGSNRVILVFNPTHIQHWIYKHFFQAGDRPDTVYIHTTYLDNLRNLDESFVNKAKRAKEEDPAWYRHNYLGEFSRELDLVFTPPDTFSDWPGEWDWEAIGGDFGFSDNPTAAVHIRKNGQSLYLKELLYGPGLTNQQIAERLKGYESILQVWDSAEKKSIMELRLAGCNAVAAAKGAGSVMFGLKKLQEYRIFIHVESVNLLNEWETYRWAKLASGEYARNAAGDRIPVKENDHGIDAVRYAVTKLINWG